MRGTSLANWSETKMALAPVPLIVLPPPATPPSNQQVVAYITDILTLYNDSQPEVKAAVPSNVIPLLKEISAAAANNAPTITDPIRLKVEAVWVDARNSYQTDDPNDPNVLRLEGDTADLITLWNTVPPESPLIPTNQPPPMVSLTSPLDDPGFVTTPLTTGDTSPNTSPLTAWDWGQGVPYNPRQNFVDQYTDESGYPLPLGVTRIPSAAITTTDYALRELLPTIVKTIQDWAVANGLPPTVQINNGLEPDYDAGSTSDHYLDTNNQSHALDFQLPSNLTPAQLSSLAAALHKAVPGLTVGLNAGDKYKGVNVPGADLLEAGSSTHVHIDDRSFADLQFLQGKGGPPVVVATKNAPNLGTVPVPPYVAVAGSAPPLIQNPHPVDDESQFDNKADLIHDMVMVDQKTGADATTALGALLQDAYMLRGNASMNDVAPLLDSIAPTIFNKFTFNDATSTFVGPLASQAANFQSYVNAGQTPGQALVHVMSDLIGTGHN
jgi:hypothetical protein